MSSFISCSDLSYAFADGSVLFERLNLSIGQEKAGLVGPNGVGKTTLLRLLQGELEPARGSAWIRGTVEVLAQRLLTDRDETVGEALGVVHALRALEAIERGEVDPRHFEEVGERWDIHERLSASLGKLGIAHLSLSRSLGTLSGGEAIKVRLARILLSSPDVVILDEPTNNLDSEGRRALYEFLESWEGCLLAVSHDRELLSKVDVIVELSNRGLQRYGGNFECYLEQREAEAAALEQRLVTADQRLKREKRDLQRSHERQEKRMSQGRKSAAKGGIPKIVAGGLMRKAQATMARAKGLHENRVQGAERELRSARELIKERNLIKIDIPDTEVPKGKLLVEMKGVNFRFFGSPLPLFLRPIDFTLRGPRRIALSGGNGAGKSTLIRILLEEGGVIPKSLQGELSGSIRLGTGRVTYLDQRVELLEDLLTLLENFARGTPHLSESDRRIRLGRFLFDRSAVNQKAGTLSGGERLRAGLACVLSSMLPPQLLILDEPTNNLDLDSVERVESALANFRGAVWVVSHDRLFLENIGVDATLAVGTG